MYIKRTFKQNNGNLSWGIVDLSQTIQIDLVTSMVPEEKDGAVVKDDEGNVVQVEKKGLVLTFPWTVQRMFPVPVEKASKKGQQPEISHYKHEPMWTNYTLVIDVPEEVDSILEWMADITK